MKWIKVERLLPSNLSGNAESDCLLLKETDSSIPVVGWYNFEKKSWYIAHWSATNGAIEVSHWMQLPEPPKED